jgi:uncharacterized protein RhaS with RHS repeats
VYDEESGLSWTRFRCFDAETGRWLSADPLGLAAGPETFGFDGNPLLVVDPLGLAGNPHGSGKSREKIEKLRRGEDVDVSSVEEARDLLHQMPEIKPHTFDRRMPVHPDEGGHSNEYWKQQPGTYRGDLINNHQPDGPVHPELPDGHRHRDSPHYNIIHPDGAKSAIIIKSAPDKIGPHQ